MGPPLPRRAGVPPERGGERPAAVALVLGAAFALLAFVVRAVPNALFDTKIIRAVWAHETTALTVTMRAATALAGAGAAPLALLLALLIRQRTTPGRARLYAWTCLSGWGLNIALKQVTHRPRPLGITPQLTPAGYYSFPSGHVMMITLILGFGALLLEPSIRAAWLRWAGIATAALLTALVGVSRVYLGAHWPTDVIGAVLAGGAWAAACTAWAERWLVPARVVQ